MSGATSSLKISLTMALNTRKSLRIYDREYNAQHGTGVGFSGAVLSDGFLSRACLFSFLLDLPVKGSENMFPMLYFFALVAFRYLTLVSGGRLGQLFSKEEVKQATGDATSEGGTNAKSERSIAFRFLNNDTDSRTHQTRFMSIYSTD